MWLKRLAILSQSLGPRPYNSSFSEARLYQFLFSVRKQTWRTCKLSDIRYHREGTTYTLHFCESSSWPWTQNAASAGISSCSGGRQVLITLLIDSSSTLDENRGLIIPVSDKVKTFFFFLKTVVISALYAVIQSSTSISSRPSMMAMSLWGPVSERS
jgi:hypothetical protein